MNTYQWSFLNEDWDYYGTRYVFESDNFTSEMIDVARYSKLCIQIKQSGNENIFKKHLIKHRIILLFD